MPPPLLPWAPRPHLGESLSGWVARVTSRYDVTAECLRQHLRERERGSPRLGSVEQLDHRTAPELVALLAAAARLPAARLRAMRVAVDDGTATRWFRTAAAWCPECVRGDLARGPETYERATWRLGCVVVCPDHGVPLQGGCRQCWDGPRCVFKPAGGWLVLACSQGGGLPFALDQPTRGLDFGRIGAFDVRLTPGLVALAGGMQRDLQAALLGAPLHRAWGAVRSGPLLLQVVGDLTYGIALACNAKVDQRTELVSEAGTVPRSTELFESVTPAALSPYGAFGAIAIAAAVLDSMGPDGSAGHAWEARRGPLAINLMSFMEWLGGYARGRLRAAAGRWDHPVGAAFGADGTQPGAALPAIGR